MANDAPPERFKPRRSTSNPSATPGPNLERPHTDPVKPLSSLRGRAKSDWVSTNASINEEGPVEDEEGEEGEDKASGGCASKVARDVARAKTFARKRRNTFSELETAPTIDRTPIKLYINRKDPCERLLHVRVRDQVGFLYALSENLLSCRIDVYVADIVTVGDDVDNRMRLRAPRPSDWKDAGTWCKDLEESLKTCDYDGYIAAASSGPTASKLAVNPHLLCVASFCEMKNTSERPVGCQKPRLKRYRLELRGINQAGLLLWISLVFAQSGFSIARARIKTKDGHIHDTFEVTTASTEAEWRLRSFLDMPANAEPHANLPLLKRQWATEDEDEANASNAKDVLELPCVHFTSTISNILDSEEEEDVSEFPSSKNNSTRRFASPGGAGVRGLPGFPETPANGFPETPPSGSRATSKSRLGLKPFGAISTPLNGCRTRLELANGDVYEGGMITASDGRGELRHGHGTYTYASPTSLYREYSGQWRNNQKHGFGLVLMRDGSAYAGQWQDNDRHGIGVSFGYGDAGAKGPGSMPTHRYEGEWAKDKPSGIGVEETEEHIYCGCFEDGEHAGRGLKLAQRIPGVLGCSYLCEGAWQPLIERLKAEELCRFPAVGSNAPAKDPQARPSVAFASPSDSQELPELLKDDCTPAPVYARGSPDGSIPDRSSPDTQPELNRRESYEMGPAVTGVPTQYEMGSAVTASRTTTYEMGPAITGATTGQSSRASMATSPSSAVSSPSLWSEVELAILLRCLGVAPEVAERVENRRLHGVQGLLEMSNSRMTRELGLVSPLERLVVRRSLQRLVEAELHENSKKGRSCCDVMNDPALSAHAIPLENLTVASPISKGGFGTVYKGTLLKEAGKGDQVQVVAVKEMLGNHHAKLYELLKEAHVMASLRHPNICRFMGVCADNRQRGKRYIVSELLDCSLFDLVHRPGKTTWAGTLDTPLVVYLGEGISAGVAYIHAKSLVHADLKSSNILIDLSLKPETGRRPSPRICDFGHAAVRTTAAVHDRLCTPHWAAPEVLRGEGLGPAADVYSVGVLLWEMLAKKIPHGDLCFGQVLAAVGWAGLTPDMESLPELPTQLRQLVEECLSFLPDERPSCSEVRGDLQKLPKRARLQALKMLKGFLPCGGA